MTMSALTGRLPETVCAGDRDRPGRPAAASSNFNRVSRSDTPIIEQSGHPIPTALGATFALHTWPNRHCHHTNAFAARPNIERGARVVERGVPFGCQVRPLLSERFAGLGVDLQTVSPYIATLLATLPSRVRWSGSVFHSRPQVRHFHQRFVLLPGFTSAAVSGAFFVGCHSAAISGQGLTGMARASASTSSNAPSSFEHSGHRSPVDGHRVWSPTHGRLRTATTRPCCSPASHQTA